MCKAVRYASVRKDYQAELYSCTVHGMLVPAIHLALVLLLCLLTAGMWRRLGQALTMDNWECAVRAKAAAYPYFGLTSGEAFPEYGKICW